MNLAIDGLKAPYMIFDHDTRHHLEGEYRTWEEAKARMDAIRGFERNLCVEGHAALHGYGNEPTWAGDGQFPPFAIFDIDAQANLLPYYATRDEAESEMARLLNPRSVDDRGLTPTENALSSLVTLVERLQDNVRDPVMLQSIVNQGSTGHALLSARGMLAQSGSGAASGVASETDLQVVTRILEVLRAQRDRLTNGSPAWFANLAVCDKAAVLENRLAEPDQQKSAALFAEPLSADQLADKYGRETGWGEHPAWPRSAWQQDVSTGDVQSGYWDWLASQVEQEGGADLYTMTNEKMIEHNKERLLLVLGLAGVEKFEARYFEPTEFTLALHPVDLATAALEATLVRVVECQWVPHEGAGVRKGRWEFRVAELPALQALNQLVADLISHYELDCNDHHPDNIEGVVTLDVRTRSLKIDHKENSGQPRQYRHTFGADR